MSQKLYGIYKGRVMRINGTSVKANIPSIHGPNGETEWAKIVKIREEAFAPSVPAWIENRVIMPNIGAGVYIMFENGEESYPLWLGEW